MDGFTLSFLALELRVALASGRVERVTQPERDTLLVLLRNGGENHRLLLSANPNQPRAQLTAQSYENPQEPPMFCMLLRKHLQGARVTAVQQPDGDRVLVFTLDCLGELGDPVQKTLVLELMGRYSNLTLVDERGVIIDSIRHVNSDMSRVRVLLPGAAFAMPPAQDKLNPATLTAEALAARLAGAALPLHKALVEHVAGMAGVCAREMCAQIGVPPETPCAQLDARAVGERVALFYKNVESRTAPVLLSDETGLAVDYFPFAYRTFDLSLQKRYPSLSAAMDAFYLGRDLRLRMQQKSAGLQKHIKNNIARLEKKRALMLDTLRESERAEQFRIFGELLTANLHKAEKGATEAVVVNYYDEAQATVHIPLQTTLSPAKNAQAYYKKYRKAKGAEQYAREQLETIHAELALLEGALDDLDKCATTTDLAEIRYLLTDHGFVRPDPTTRKRKKLLEGKPYRFLAPDGTEIEVGKNALQNDRMTLHARGGETWLHAQGIPGSHVIVRTEAEPSPETLLYAAKLAAYFSKGRNHPSLPVDYVKRKHVRKAAGAVAGLVTYTNFQTVLVGLSTEEIVTIGRSAAKA
jgi:predicted ribosome quality control (RQC) complex YloA/Tae2 family protein